MAAVESTVSARLTRGSVPSGLTSPALCATPTSVPVLSNTSTKKNVKTMAMSPISSALTRSSLRKTGAMDGGSETTPLNLLRPSASAGDRRGQDADQDRARHPAGIERGHQDEPDHGQHHGRRLQVAQRHQRRRVRLDDAGALQADDGEEQADAGRDRQLEALRDGVDHPLADGREADDQEQDAGQEHGAQRRLPGVAHALDDAVGEVGVEPHARRERHGIVGVEPHEGRAERRGQAGGDEHGPLVHAGVGQDRRVDEDDVGHGHERRQAGQQLGPDVGAVLFQFESSLEHVALDPAGGNVRPTIRMAKTSRAGASARAARRQQENEGSSLW